MKKNYLLLITFFILACCKSYEPFESRKEKRQVLKHIQNNLSLTKLELKKLKSNDSVLLGISISLKKNVLQNKIQRRVDSFLLDKYNVSELWTMLYIEREFPDKNFEINKSKTLKSFEFKDAKELKKFFNKGGFDSIIKTNVNIKKEKSKDSINKKN